MSEEKRSARGNQPAGDRATDLSELQLLVKSRILERIQQEFERGAQLAASTQYVKSDGTNYGMYTKSDDFSILTDIWEVVFNRVSIRQAGEIRSQGGGQTG